jgi:hypothetical protein
MFRSALYSGGRHRDTVKTRADGRRGMGPPLDPSIDAAPFHDPPPTQSSGVTSITVAPTSLIHSSSVIGLSLMM